jgi:hypothetical protein
MAMEEADKARFVQVLVGVADYYDRELSETSIAVYWTGLKRYDLKAVERAFFNHTQSPDNGKFMPKVADISLMLEGTSTDSAYLAWTKAENAVKRCGSYQDVVFDDWIIHRVIFDMGGWIALCSKTEKEWPFIGREFEQRYRGYSIKRVTEQYPQILIGQAGAHNRKAGYPVEPPVLIGDVVKAQAVIAGGVDLVRIGFTQATDLAGHVTKKLTDG